MEKEKIFGLTTKNKITWHQRRSLHFGETQSRFYVLHPDPRRLKAKRRENAEKTIFEILINNPPEMIEGIEIKHITEEK